MSNWMQSLPKTLYLMDALLLILFVLSNVPQISLPFHEWVSFIFIVPFIIHLLLHWNWAVKVPSLFLKKMSGSVRFNVVFDILLYLMMIFVIVSGIFASVVVLPLFGDFEAQPFWTQVHYQYSNMLMPLIGIHLAMHWHWIKRMTANMLKRTSNTGVGAVQEEAG